MREWKKIMKIKGILNLPPDTVDTKRPYPKNCYSGLNALRERMKNSQGISDDSPQNTNCSDSTATRKAELVGAPINFFFKINTATLTSKAQQLNIAEIAKVAKEHHLLVRIVGAADKATGTSERNKELSLRRAEYNQRTSTDTLVSYSIKHIKSIFFSWNLCCFAHASSFSV